ncbi:MAG: hypothetical protein KH544_08845 [Firmicutes bacterium]|nr:hypothetical protein [Bacillota bacterium]
MQITQLRGLLFHLDPAMAEVNHKSEENSLDPIQVEATSLGNFFKKTKKDCCEKQFWLFYIVKGMRVPGKGMEGGQNKVPELG